MIKVDIIKDSDSYKLNGCSLKLVNPMACQAKGCIYWRGYVFMGAYYKGYKDYISSQWRRLMNDEVVVADYVKCGLDEYIK